MICNFKSHVFLLEASCGLVFSSGASTHLEPWPAETFTVKTHILCLCADITWDSLVCAPEDGNLFTERYVGVENTLTDGFVRLLVWFRLRIKFAGHKTQNMAHCFVLSIKCNWGTGLEADAGHLRNACRLLVGELGGKRRVIRRRGRRRVSRWIFDKQRVWITCSRWDRQLQVPVHSTVVFWFPMKGEDVPDELQRVLESKN